MSSEMNLDSALLATLTEHFLKIQTHLEFRIGGNLHKKYGELKAMLIQVSACSPFLSVTEDSSAQFEVTGGLGFEILRSQKATGIVFLGVPGGHEFSSFILAILNAAGLGKMPDDFLQAKIKSLKGPVRLRTFISLSCENCPEVVQTLNQMALLNPDFVHEMIDGDLATEEVSRLKIGSVPAVFCGDELVVSGKLNFVTLLEKLKARFGEVQASLQDGAGAQGQAAKVTRHCDVLVVGGGPAGASAAIYTARKGLSTVIVAERMGGQVKDTKGIENLISTVYTEGERLVDDLNKHLNAYPIEILEHRRVSKFNFSDLRSKSAELSTGEVITFDRLIFATGANWRELKVPGEKEYLGRGVAFCPHCDGPLYKGKSVAVIGGGNSGVEAALDLAGICKEITLFEFAENLKADQVLVDKVLQTPNIKIILNAMTEEVLGNGTNVVGLKYQNRESKVSQIANLDGVFVQIGLVPNSSTLVGLVEMNPFGEIKIDAHGRTSVPGVYAAGDVTTVPYKQIIVSLGEGAKAALAAFEDRVRGA